MKISNYIKHYLVIILGLSLIGCSSKKYVLADLNADNQRLVELLTKLKKEQTIKNNPVVVINEKVVGKDELKRLKIFNSEIVEIAVIEKNKADMKKIYGDQSKNGIILITTKPIHDIISKNTTKSTILFILDGKPISKEQMEKISTNNIKTVTVIKDKKKILKYSKESYDGVVIIEMKNN